MIVAGKAFDLAVVGAGILGLSCALAAARRGLKVQMPRCRLQSEQAEYLRHGIHLIIAQGSDGSVVVGDSHHADSATAPFADEAVYGLLLDDYRLVTGESAPRLYASAGQEPMPWRKSAQCLSMRPRPGLAWWWSRAASVHRRALRLAKK